MPSPPAGPVRTRVAPSPTGDPHVGTAYVALFNYCFAKKHGGQFILRIEDTDQARSTASSEQAILDSLRWIGIPWDEGPDRGGPHAPYRQSERSALYQAHARELVDKGHAFRCFCTREVLDAMREQQRADGVAVPGYDGRCGHLSGAEIQARLDAGTEHVVRMWVPREGVCQIQDVLRGTIEIPWTQVDMQVLLKSDGLPTYHLANVVDDHHMGITHVIRGEEWINSAPKHLKLYEYFGWQPPVLCHLPLLRNPDKSKLSKRKNPTSILWYQRMGYLPEALLNYLGTMAWTMPGDQELFTLDDMAAIFDIDQIALGGPVFDLAKLDWLGGKWIRERIDDAELGRRVRQWALNEDYLAPLLPHLRPRVNKLSEMVDLVDYFFKGGVSPDAAALVGGRMDEEATRRLFQFCLWRLGELDEWTREGIEQALRVLTEQLDLKLRDALKPIYVAISGRPTALPLFDSMAHLGRDLSRSRLQAALELLGAPGNKVLRRYEKEYAALGR